MSTTTPDMQAAAKQFFTASHFAVAGASSNPAKFGHKVFVWYRERGLSAIPLNPTQSSIEVGGESIPTASSPGALADPAATSLSVITPPAVTKKLLREAKDVGVKAVWLQPGTYDDEVWDFAVKEFPGAAVGGFADGTVGGEGWCVLVDGDTAMHAAGRDQKL